MDTAAMIGLLKQTFTDWNEDKAPRLAAALAFYTAFATAPLLLIAIAVAGFFFGREAATQQIGQQISSVLGSTAGDAINTMVQAANERQGTGIIASIVGIATLLFAASGVFGELQNALDTIWEVKPKANSGIWGTIRQRFFSFTMVVGVGFLLLVSLVISTLLSTFGTALAGDQFGQALFWKVINFVVSFAVTTGVFALVYKVIPDVHVEWNDVWIGALATAVLFTVGKIALGWYLGRPATTSTYGAAGSFVALLLWLYYSAQIMFVGAEFTQVYARRYGSRIEPDANAVPLTEEARAQQGIPHTQPDRSPQPAHQASAGDSKHREAASAAGDRSTRLVSALGFVVGLVLGRRKATTSRSDDTTGSG